MNLPDIQTHDEIRAEYARSMGQDLGQLYHELEKDLSWLHDKWSEFKELYGKGPERIALLNETASSFFYIVQQTLCESILLHLCRITDPPESMSSVLKKKVPNLSCQRLANLITDPSLKASVDAQMQKVHSTCEFARAWRNRRLAHSDLMTLRGKHPYPLPPANINKVEDALASICDLHNMIGQHFGHSQLLFTVRNPWGASLLVHHLDVAVRVEEEERECFRKLAEEESNEPQSQ